MASSQKFNQQQLLSLSHSEAYLEQISRGNYNMSYATQDQTVTATTASIDMSNLAALDDLKHQNSLNETDKEIQHRTIDQLEISA